MSEIRSQATPARDVVNARDIDRFALAELIHVNICHRNLENCEGECDLTAKEAVTAGWSKPRTVNIATELDALPMFTVIRSEQGSVWERQYGALGKPLWIEATQTRGFPHTSDEITLPATVLFTPGDAG